MGTVALNQGMFTWRHDNVLHQLTKVIKTLTKSGTDVFADLPNLRINGGTIPADILVLVGERSKPDLVVIDITNK